MSDTWNLAPYLRTKNAAEAISWYVRALGAVEVSRHPMPDGRIGHAELNLHGSTLYLADAPPERERDVRSYQDVPILLYAHVPDVDAAYERALAEGAGAERPPADQSYGERSAGFIDPFGHVWYLAATLQR